MPFKSETVLRTYRSWKGMKFRCSSPPDDPNILKNYAGVTFCDRWKDFKNFVADMGLRPEGLILDRIKHDRPYEPGNCRWVTPKISTENRRNTVWLTINGQKIRASQAAEMAGIPEHLVFKRLKAGWPHEEIVAIGAVQHGFTRDGSPINPFANAGNIHWRTKRKNAL